jgi:2-polyprenyl-6-methoxyphenol hydroxylase-like FAD-dependent oxidoreductase
VAVHVIIIGGGIGGLCLAQGLRKAGVSAAVYEKGPRRADPHWLQGYQIHINPSGSRALQECLPPAVWDSVVANACVPSAGFQVLTEQMKQIAFVRPELMDGASHIPIVRAALREVLLEGLEEVVNFGKEFVRCERTPNGRVTAFFEDGTTAAGDVLIGADGTGSNVRQQYLPHARIVDTGIVGAACRLPITPDSRRRLPRHLLTRLTSVVPPKGTYMIVTQSIYRSGAKYIDVMGDHLIWVLISSRAAYGDANPKMMNGRSISRLALRMIDYWHPLFRELIADSDPKQVTAVPVLTSIPVDPWESTNITLLGDAIHTMTPLQGLGGSTALRDAGLLCRQLIEVDRGACTLIMAIGQYEKAMINYGFAAVRRSAWFGNVVVSDNRPLRGAFKAALRIATRISPLARRMFRPPA